MQQSIRLHLPAIPYTITRSEFSHDAFTGKVLRFPKMMMSRGFEVYHYGVETSETGATRQIDLMTKEEWMNLRIESIMHLDKKLTREQAIIKNNDPTLIISELSNWSTPLAKEFNRRFREKLAENYRGRKTDIVCLPLGRMHEAGIQGLSCTAVEIGIGYSDSFTDFRVFEAYSWMSRTLGIEDKQPNNYWFVVPHAFDINEFKLSLNPVPKRVGFLGRITNLKGCGIIKEIAKRFPDIQFILCGQGDPAPFLDVPNILYKPPIHGEERSEYLGSCVAFLHLAKYLEPFGCGPVEAQLCGTPVICSDWGGMAETVEQGCTGLRGHTLADYCHGVQMALDGKFDRSYIRKRAAELFDMYKLAPRYEYIFKSIIDIYTPGKNGWYSPDTHIRALLPAKQRIFICIPYYGAFPNYFQLYLDSAGINADILAVILITDIDTSSYTVPANVFVYKMPRQDIQKRAAKFIKDVYDKTVAPEELLKDNYKFVDFKIVYPILFADMLKELGAGPQDFVGWGDIDLIYGKLSNFIRLEEGYGILGGWHGHFTAIVNDEEFKYNFKTIPNYLELITDNSKTFITDEIAYREPLKAYLARKNIKMFYTNASFCDIVPPCFYDRFRKDHIQRKKNFFDVYNSTKDITNLFYNKELSNLTVYYDDGSSRETLYCHLQKRKMDMPFHSYENGYYIHESRFSTESPIPKKIWQTWETMELPGGLQKCVEEIKEQNPDFEHFLFDAAGRRAFIAEHFPKEFVVAYDCLKPGAYKADFWRYCVLYIHGGIYIDIKMKFAEGFRLCDLIAKESFISDGTLLFEGQKTKSLSNGILFRKKGSPILLYSIINIIYNVCFNILGNNPFHPTGPQLLGTNYRRSKSTTPIEYYFYNGHVCRNDGTLIAQTLMNYKDIYYRNCEEKNNNYYIDMWKKGCIYEKCEIDLAQVYKNSLWPKKYLDILGEFIPLDLNVIMRGHFHTFHNTNKSWERALSSCKHDVYMHTWDTKTWYSNTGANTNNLLKEDIELLRRFDKDCVIEAQSWTEEERQAIVLSRPFKTFLYYWQGIHSCINRIRRESKYILIGRYDVAVDIDFSSVVCEEGEIVIGYTHRYPNIPFKYGCTDIIFLIHYKDKDKLLEIPQNILDMCANKNTLYEIAEDPITDFFYTHWKKVTPKWFGTKDFTIVREPHIYDFIEIGTSDFDTEIQKNDSRVGLSIEPVKYYLERLPNRTRCKKLNMAVSNYNGTGKVFFVNDANIQKYKLPNWVRGCNTINSYHKTVCNLLEKNKLSVEENIDSYEINIQTLYTIFLENKVEFVYYLKIDTEGHDVVILKKFCEDIVKNGHFPHVILFESNELTTRKDLDEIIELYGQKGYDLIERGYNTTLKLNLMKLEGKTYFTPALYNYSIDSSFPAYDMKTLPYKNTLEDAKRYCIEHRCMGVSYENGIYQVKYGKYIRPCDDRNMVSWLYL